MSSFQESSFFEVESRRIQDQDRSKKKRLKAALTEKRMSRKQVKTNRLVCLTVGNGALKRGHPLRTPVCRLLSQHRQRPRPKRENGLQGTGQEENQASLRTRKRGWEATGNLGSVPDGKPAQAYWTALPPRGSQAAEMETPQSSLPLVRVQLSRIRIALRGVPIRAPQLNLTAQKRCRKKSSERRLVGTQR